MIRPMLRMLGISSINLQFNDDKTCTARFEHNGRPVIKVVNLAEVEAEFNAPYAAQDTAGDNPANHTDPPPNAA